MGVTEVAAITSGAVTAISLLIGAYGIRRALRPELRLGGAGISFKLKPLEPVADDQTIETRLRDAAASMKSTSELLTLAQVEIDARLAKATQLATEVEENEKLASLTKAQKDAVASALHAEVEAQNKALRAEVAAQNKALQTALESASKSATRLTVGLSVLFFIAGVAATVLVTLLVHPLS